MKKQQKTCFCRIAMFSLLLLATNAKAQIGIGTTSPDSSSVIDLRSSTRGILIPRMTSLQRKAIAAPAKGLMVFDNDSAYFFFYNGTGWVSIKSNTTASYIAGSGINISAGGTISAQMGTAKWNANRIASQPVSPTLPSNNQVLKWNSGLNEWTPATDTAGAATYSAGTGLSLTGTTFSAQNTSAQWNASQIEGTGVSSSSPTSGQVLKYNSTTGKWEPNADNNTTYNAGAGIVITGTLISADSANAVWNSNKIQNVSVSTTAPTNGQVLQYSSSTGKWMPNTISTGTNYTSGAGITISGTTISADSTNAAWNANKIQSKKISPVSPGNNQVLKWNSGLNEWTPATDTSASYAGGTGISISGSTISGAYTAGGGITIAGAKISADSNTAVWNANKLEGTSLSSTAPTSGQILQYSSSTGKWAPATIIAGGGITISGSTISADSNNAVWNTNKIQGNKISPKAPANNQVLKWNSGLNEWTPATDTSGSSAGGWSTTGNGGMGSTNFIGTTDNNAFNIKENNTQVANFQANSMSLGNGANINNATNSYALGTSANIGYNKKYSVAIGDGATISNDSAFALGDNAAVNGYNSYAIGNNSAANGTATMAIGSKASAGYSINGAVALGQSAAVAADSAYAIGNNSQANLRNSLAIGSNSASNSVNSVAIGKGATVGWSITDALALGDNSNATSSNSIAIGSSASSSNKTQANGANSIAIGTTATANSASGIAIGRKTTVGWSLTTSMAIGDSATVNGSNSIAFGAGANIGYYSNGTVLGNGASVSGSNSTAIGYNAKATTSNAIVLGNGSANVGVGTSAPNSTAVLDLTSTTQGFLAPRMTTTQRKAISSPATGLEVFDNTVDSLYIYNGTKWANISTAASGGSSQWTTSGSNIYNGNTANVGIGKTSPSYKLDVTGPVNADSVMIDGATVLKTKGTENIFLGQSSGIRNSGSDNYFSGYNAGYHNTTASENHFDGFLTGYNNTTGSYNQFSGYSAGYSNTTGSENQFEGYAAGYLNTTGVYNYFSGFEAGMVNTTGSYNHFEGYGAGVSNTTGNNNYFSGFEAGYSNTTGTGNSFSGYGTGLYNTTGNYNSFFGFEAGFYNSTGSYNNFSGYASGIANTTGGNNNFSGYYSGSANTTGSNNNILGSYSGYDNTTGSNNNFLGYQAGYTNTTGYSNAVLGAKAGYGYNGSRNTFIGDSADANTSGLTNATAIGYNAKVGQSNSIVLGNGSANVGIGNSSPAASALLDLTSTTQGMLAPRMTTTQRRAISSPATGLIVFDNTVDSLYIYNGTAWANISVAASGSASPWTTSGHAIYNNNTSYVGIGKTNPSYELDVKGPVNTDSILTGGTTVLSTKGSENTILGLSAGIRNSGTGNTFLGYFTGNKNTTGNNNYFSGSAAGYANTTGGNNSFVGYQAGWANTTGGNNTFVGNDAGMSNTTAGNNTFIGYYAGLNNTTGGNNVFVGYDAGYSNTTGYYNQFEGYQAGLSNTTGNSNYFSGYTAGYANTTGNNNYFSGLQAGMDNTTGSNNQFIGINAGYSNTTGINNNFSGYYAGSANSTGYSNVYLGTKAGYSYNGNRNTFIGDSADASAANFTNATAIGYNAKVGESNAIVLGNGSANVGIGTSTPGNFLEIYSGTGGTSGLRMREMPSGAILFMNASGDVAQNNSNFYFDATNYRLSVGAGTSPNSTITDGGSFAAGIGTVTASYTASVSDYTILCNATSLTISLPQASGCKGRMYVIKNISSSGSVTLAGYNGSDKIDGSPKYYLTSQYKYVTVQSDGSNWFIISNN